MSKRCGINVWITDIEFVANLSIGFEFSVIRATPVTTDKSSVFVLHRIFLRDIWVHHGPQVRV